MHLRLPVRKCGFFFDKATPCAYASCMPLLFLIVGDEASFDGAPLIAAGTGVEGIAVAIFKLRLWWIIDPDVQLPGCAGSAMVLPSMQDRQPNLFRSA